MLCPHCGEKARLVFPEKLIFKCDNCQNKYIIKQVN